MTTFPDGAEIIRQGDSGETFYVIQSGRAEVSIDGYVVGVLTHGMGFGERALLRGGPRAATVTARGDVSAIAISRDLFLAAVAGGGALLAQDTTAGERPLADVLRALPLFARLPRDELGQAAKRFTTREFEADSALVRQGDAGDRYFVILGGTADVVVDGAVVGRLMPGDGFGEIALLHDVPRRATVTARERVKVATLERASFAELAALPDVLRP
jgi:cAMP-dependent protein kinase regulator